jgi:hypothetical protein
VRVTAAEIRKRIAQYYQEPGHENELRISLPPDSYVPHFDSPTPAFRLRPAPAESEPPAPASATPSRSVAEPQPAVDPSPKERWKPAWLLPAGLALLTVLSAAAWTATHSPNTPLDRFWAPMINAGDPVLLRFPDSHFNGIALRDAADPAQRKQMQESVSALGVDDLQPVVSLSGLLQLRHQSYHLLGADTATLTDLRQGPAILLGAFDNAWTLRMTRNLRFRFGNDPEMRHFWIEDTQSPQHTHWTIDRSQQTATHNYRDYAIVARFVDANTGKLTLVSAGIAGGGTIAAGEFLTTPQDMELIQAQAPRNWDGMNLEVVLSTEIIDGRSSPPKIEATYFW